MDRSIATFMSKSEYKNATDVYAKTWDVGSVPRRSYCWSFAMELACLQQYPNIRRVEPRNIKLTTQRFW